MADAKVEYEYSVWNEDDILAEISEEDAWLFNSPVRDFETQHAAEHWSRKENLHRNSYRADPTCPITWIDRLAGKPVDTIVKRRLVIKLDWETLPKND